MTFSEALGQLIAAGAVKLGKMIRNELQQNPDLFNGVFTPTPNQPQPHFQTTGPKGGVWYLRPFHNDKTSIQFGNDS
jgi:hypothetical protein